MLSFPLVDINFAFYLNVTVLYYMHFIARHLIFMKICNKQFTIR